MAKVQTIRARIKSVKNINQITKAMEMVAASKLRRAQEATLRSRIYAISAREALARLRRLATTDSHPLFEAREVKNRLIILFSSDRGLAGAYNSNVLKNLVALLKTPTDSKVANQIIVVGQKGGAFVSKLKGSVEVLGVYTDWPARPTIQDILPIAATALDRFKRHEADEVVIVYTDFVSTIKQLVVARTILPINPEEFVTQEAKLRAGVPESLFEPSPSAVFSFVVPRLVEVQIYQASLEAAASEQAMRMVAMKNASDNAKEIIGDLTLTYNGARQASITQELAEISAGAEAIK